MEVSVRKRETGRGRDGGREKRRKGKINLKELAHTILGADKFKFKICKADHQAGNPGKS